MQTYRVDVEEDPLTLERPAHLAHRVGLNRRWGLPVGIPAARWPRRDGRPMRHLATFDLLLLPSLGPFPRKSRLLTVFVDQLGDIHTGRTPHVVLRWVSASEVACYGTAEPPLDLPEEALACPSRGFATEPVYGLTPRWWDAEENHLGGEPAWAGVSPTNPPDGAFVMQLSSTFHGAPGLVLYLFVGGVWAARRVPAITNPAQRGTAGSCCLALADEPILAAEDDDARACAG